MRKLILIGCGCLLCAGFFAIFFFLAGTMIPTTTSNDHMPPGQVTDTEAKLRARVAELEAQVKRQAKQRVQMTVTEESSPLPSVKTQGWRTVASGGGSGMGTTETFQITGSEWRIHWKTVSSGPAGDLFQIFVYDSNGRLVTMAANAMNAGADTSYVIGKPGRYYLSVNSGTNWAVIIEER